MYVDDPDDWDLPDKRFMWLPSYEQRSPYFDVHSNTGMITMKEGTPNGTYMLRFNVSNFLILALNRNLNFELSLCFGRRKSNFFDHPLKNSIHDSTIFIRTNIVHKRIIIF